MKITLSRIEEMLGYIRGHIIADDRRMALQILKELEEDVQEGILEELNEKIDTANNG